ncbi:alpha/beta fold hydrolase [Nocardia huaxiensis]|uniref:Alpha/beta hydrolase n=1 Tax=Nocardia huaxiensis TaxID=2755382 RepID=A0A7D6VAM7_9NOCA|nr:alpha/beta hydrolase [Nocardia huaxiensis]QLY30894.1 alpha/beta hydrolase [Nocardia huaxiensis]UFS94405.1 alpha/beta hydrolase [Nocardia huaxiensis]
MVKGAPLGTTPEPQLRTGRGEPLLLLHGALLTWESWLPVLDDLAADHDVLAITYPGHHGGPEPKRPATIASLADHAEQALDEAGWATAHLAGNSLGGWLALELAARGRARTVTAIAPGGLWRNPAAADSLLRKFRTFGPLIGLDTDAPPTSPALIRSLLLPLLAHRPAIVPNHVAKAMAAAPANCTIVEEIAEDPALPTGFTAMDALDVPVTILLPEHDRVLPPHVYAPLVETPTREIRPLPGLGHIPMLEDPARITAEIRATISRAA